MTEQKPRPSSGGGMYDPARDTWDDRSGNRDGSQLHRGSDQGQSQPLFEQSGPDSSIRAPAMGMVVCTSFISLTSVKLESRSGLSLLDGSYGSS